MAVLRHTLIALLLGCAIVAAQPTVVPSPIPASRLLQTSRVEGPLEVRPATADEEAILAGTSYVKSEYEAPGNITVVTFITTYRDALFAGGWKLIASPKVDNVAPPEGVADIAAHYMANSRNVYTRLSRSPEGQYEINVADVGEEDWPALLAKQCHVPIYSLHFDLDRPSLKLFESEPTLQKLANALKTKSAPAVEIQGHMDNVGEAGVAARQTLSEARARTVAAWLTAHGVPAAKISSKGYGKSKPVADNDTDLGRAMNRRIEIAAAGCARVSPGAASHIN